MRTLIHERVEQARLGKNLNTICRVASVWLFLGDHQFLRGYCVLAPDPVVESINTLTGGSRAQFLLDMAAVGDALLAVTGAWRINYAILGNGEPALHAHVRPRCLSEPEDLRRGPVQYYDRDLLASVPFDLERDQPLMDKIRQELMKAGVDQV